MTLCGLKIHRGRKINWATKERASRAPAVGAAAFRDVWTPSKGNDRRCEPGQCEPGRGKPSCELCSGSIISAVFALIDDVVYRKLHVNEAECKEVECTDHTAEYWGAATQRSGVYQVL